MKRLALITALIVASCAYACADANVYVTQTPQGGLKGLVIDRPISELYAVGISWQQSEVPAWGMGLDISQDYPGVPDLVLAYSPASNHDVLRMRADDARMLLGPSAGHPSRPFQLDVESDYRNSGLCVGTSGWETSIYLHNQESPSNNRTTVNFNGLWGWGTDLAPNGGGDFWLWNFQTQTPVLQFSAIGGIGFFGAPAATKPVVTGSWSDGSAAKSVLAALVKLGLATDSTTP